MISLAITAGGNIVWHRSSHDSAIMSATPKVKRNLETLIFRVKQLAFANDALDKFWVGNLKNRDLDGTHITDDAELKTSGSDYGVGEGTGSDGSGVTDNEGGGGDYDTDEGAGEEEETESEEDAIQ